MSVMFRVVTFFRIVANNNSDDEESGRLQLRGGE